MLIKKLILHLSYLWKIKMKNNLQQIRQNSGMTQQEVADSLFVTRQSISRWENGSREPSISVLEDLAKLYNSSVPVLLGYEVALTRKTNYFSILGNFIFNFFVCLPVVGVVGLLSFIVGCFSFALIMIPMYVLYEKIFQNRSINFVLLSYHPQGFSAFFLYIITFLLGLALIYALLSLSRLFLIFLKKYFKYSFKSIRYDIIKR